MNDYYYRAPPFFPVKIAMLVKVPFSQVDPRVIIHQIAFLDRMNIGHLYLR